MEKLAKRVRWIGPSKKDLQAFPKVVRRLLGQSIWDAQEGRMPRDGKVLHGFTGASVVEIRASHMGSAYRAVYTVRFDELVFVLHVFQKKSKKGNKTPADVMDLIRKRLKTAEDEYEKWKAEKGRADGG
jgi:phage-related protein